MADVLMYLVRLADKCGIDLPAVADSKIRKNQAKYPASLVRGSAKKYNEYGAAEVALAASPSVLPGLGPRRAEALARRELHSVGDLLLYLPSSYDDRRSLCTVATSASSWNANVVEPVTPATS